MGGRFSPWSFSRASALARLDDDEVLLQDVIAQFVEDAPAALAAIEQAIATGDGSALREAAHSLKGAAGYLAADDLCALAQTLEGYGVANQLAQARQTWPALDAVARNVVESLTREIAPPPTAA